MTTDVRMDAGLLQALGTVSVRGDAAGAAVRGVTADSRRAGPGVAFVAVRGAKADGHAYVAAAVAAGCPLVVVQDDVDVPGAPSLRVRDSRLALSLLAAWCHGWPSREFLLAGITGTDGKTSTAMITAAGFEACGLPPGVVGTVEYRYAGVREPSPMTTPDPVDLQALFARMRDAAVKAVAMEVSSHALDQRRVDGCRFAVGALTCLTRDHLDYHGTVEAYADAKARFFTEVLPANPDARGAVVNGDDAFGRRVQRECPLRTLAFSRVAGGGDLCPEEATYNLFGIRARVRTPWGTFPVQSPLMGPHNLQNLMAALGMAGLLGLDLPRFLQGVCAVDRIPGRLERVTGRRDAVAFVDYAHTPAALVNVLTVLRPLVGGRRLSVVMGAGGDRDRGKRPLMGRAAVQHADRVIVTSDNPRTEDPLAIIGQIVEGIDAARAEGLAVAPHEVEPDRREAIRKAVEGAVPGEVIVIAGKGHEDYQVLGTAKVHFSDVETAKEMLDA